MSLSSPPPPRRPRAERSDRTIDVSRRVAAALLDHAETVAREPRLARDRKPDVPSELPLADVQFSLERYASHAHALSRRNRPTPVLFSAEGPVEPACRR